MLPEPWVKVESVPPTVVISLAVKLAEISLRVKVKLAVSPDFKAEADEVIVIVGATVSMLIESWEAAVLGLPAPSVKVLAKTLMVAVVVLLLVGVNIAV